MIHINNFKNGKAVYDALNSDVRLEMMDIILKQETVNLNAFATKLNLSNSAITAHIKKLELAGLVRTVSSSGYRGTQKICKLNTDRIIVDIVKCREENPNSYKFEIGVGHYTNYFIKPTCGMVNLNKMIGEFDNPVVFAYPERIDAAMLWFNDGFVEYLIPNKLAANEKPLELQVSMELSSEAPGYSHYFPSDIYFSINNVELGYYTSPGEYNDRHGIFTPDWWFPNLGQYGQLKMISINNNGTFIDGLKISDVKISDLNLNFNAPIQLKISTPETAKNHGGLILFGKGFGDFNQGILVNMIYE